MGGDSEVGALPRESGSHRPRPLRGQVLGVGCAPRLGFWSLAPPPVLGFPRSSRIFIDFYDFYDSVRKLARKS